MSIRGSSKTIEMSQATWSSRRGRVQAVGGGWECRQPIETDRYTITLWKVSLQGSRFAKEEASQTKLDSLENLSIIESCGWLTMTYFLQDWSWMGDGRAKRSRKMKLLRCLARGRE